MQKSKSLTILNILLLTIILGSAYLFYSIFFPGNLLQKNLKSVSYHILNNISISHGRINDVPLYVQSKNLSCEATSIKMVLKYYGIESSEDRIQAMFQKNPNPNLGFRGDVNGQIWGFDDYGVYADPVAQVIQKFGLTAKVHKNITQEELQKKVLDGKPAIIWVNIANKNPEEKIIKVSNQNIKLISGEHTVVVTGYKNGFWYLNDPWNKTTINGEKIANQIMIEDLNEIMWNSFDNMTVTVEKPKDVILLTSNFPPVW